MTAKNTKRILVMAALFCCIMITGCGDSASSDPVERGCENIASAIILSAIIRAFCNK